MDNAVALVESYLRVNGYFTVTEYCLVETDGYGGFRTATDLDILAFRFPGAGRLLSSNDRADGRKDFGVYAPDPALGVAGPEADMIIGEVKEGRAELNEAATDPAVLQAVLTRFGCCEPQNASAVVKDLLSAGRAQTHCRHRVRLVAFGSVVEEQTDRKHRAISLGHVQQFLQEYLREHWEALSHAQFKDPAFGFLVMLEKARRASHESLSAR